MPQKPKSTQKNLQKTAIIAVLLTVVAVLALFFLRENSVASITVAPTGNDGRVFIDKKQMGRLSAQSSTTVKTSPGSKQVLVSGQNTYPWRESVSLTAGSSTTVTPFLISQRPRQIANPPEEITQQLDRVAGNPPTSTVTPDESIEVVVTEDGRLGARWQKSTSSAPAYFTCTDNSCRAIIYDNNSRLAEQVGSYPGRSDAVIFATETGVYVLEIDPTGNTQNFQPVIQDVRNPHFVMANSTVFVRAGQQITATQL